MLVLSFDLIIVVVFLVSLYQVSTIVLQYVVTCNMSCSNNITKSRGMDNLGVSPQQLASFYTAILAIASHVNDDSDY